METIAELREICQTTRPSIFKDPLSRLYYKISIYLTWICLNLKMSANQVTILSGLIAILGGLLIASESIFVTLIGAMCFHLFAILLDMSDGEVARYRGEGGVEGHYLDWFMHFITPTALVIGLFLGSLEDLYSSGLFYNWANRCSYTLTFQECSECRMDSYSLTILRDKKSGALKPQGRFQRFKDKKK